MYDRPSLGQTPPMATDRSSDRPGLLADAALAVALAVLVGVGGACTALYLGLRAWAGADAAALAPANDRPPHPAAPPYDWTPVVLFWVFVLALLLITVLSARGRLRITPVLHGLLLAALLLGGSAGYAYQHRHDGDYKPRPLPSDYHPCYSGSNDCD